MVHLGCFFLVLLISVLCYFDLIELRTRSICVCGCVFDLHFTEVFLVNIHNVYSADKPFTPMHFHLEQCRLLGQIQTGGLVFGARCLFIRQLLNMYEILSGSKYKTCSAVTRSPSDLNKTKTSAVECRCPLMNFNINQ